MDATWISVPPGSHGAIERRLILDEAPGDCLQVVLDFRPGKLQQ